VGAARAVRPFPFTSPAPLPLSAAVRSLSTGSKGAGVVEVTDDAEYSQALASKGLCVVYFTASWCGPCQKIKPIYEQLATDFPQTTFIKVDVDECAEIAAGAEVRAMPTFHFMKDGKLAGPKSESELVGADPAQLLAYVKHWS
jgi:thiol-disulfide isomerase/thioredoxin